jgi:hypothetical protein
MFIKESNLSKLSSTHTIFKMGCRCSRQYNQVQVDADMNQQVHSDTYKQVYALMNKQESIQVQEATVQKAPVPKPHLYARVEGWRSDPIAEKRAIGILDAMMAEHKEKLERAKQLAKWA